MAADHLWRRLFGDDDETRVVSWVTNTEGARLPALFNLHPGIVRSSSAGARNDH
jgi:hypothetical protein